VGYNSSEHTKVFVSYSHKDRKHLERLQVHLKDLERKGMIDLWSDTKIVSGANWREEIKRAIETASVGVLLVSADFLASQFIAEDELPPLLKVAETRGTVILSVILSPCGFDFSPLSQFQAANDPSKPLTKMNSHQKEELWNKVAKIIRDTIITSKFTRDGSSYEAESNEYAEHKRLFHVSYGPLPSKATVKTNNQFIMLEARSGGISSYMLEIVKEVLADIERISQTLQEGDYWGGGQEFLMFRGAWFDDKHGGVILFIDLLHDVSVQPTLIEENIRKSFYDGFAWYGNQGISVVPRIIKVNTSSDGFFKTGNEYYIGFPWF
jgi:TIR domain